MDLARIQELLDLMKKYDLHVLKVKEEGVEYEFDRQMEKTQPVAAPMIMPPVMQHSVPVAGAPVHSVPSAAPANAVDAGCLAIKSPMVGTFYRAPSPDSEPYVKIGDHVSPDTVVCIVEAMKVMNEITADCSGTIKKILIENSKPVEYGQVLFVVEPS